METNHDESSNPGLAKLKEFAESIKKHQPIVFCVQCGSTLIDQTAIYKLTCLKCENTVLWDGYTFAIARDGSVHDATSSFLNEEFYRDYFDDWRSSVIRAIQDFSRIAINSEFMVVSDGSEKNLELEKQGSEFERFVEDWNQCKAKIDKLLETKEGSA